MVHRADRNRDLYRQLLCTDGFTTGPDDASVSLGIDAIYHYENPADGHFGKIRCEDNKGIRIPDSDESHARHG